MVKRTVSGIMLTLLLIGMLTLAFSFQPIFNSKAYAISVATRMEKAVDFLVLSQFDLHLNLCREAPEAAPNRYWLVSDNLWAFKALRMANESGLSNAIEAGRIANLIEAKLKEKANIHNLPTDPDGFPISFMHEAVIGDSIPTPNRTYNQITLQSNNYTIETEIYNGTIMSDWQEYADRLLYMALSLHWQVNDTGANYYFELAKAMWDEIGINDKATEDNGHYATYKLALILYASKVLRESLSFEFELVKRIYSLQRDDGGITTNYFANGTAHGDVNTETTSIVTIAILAPPRTITVPDDYPTIQEAINAANPGDTIYVKAGTYYENVVINKTVSLVGESRETTIIDGDRKGTVLLIKADNTNISGFTARNSGSASGGFYVDDSRGINATHNIARNNCYGFWLEQEDNTVTGNTLSDNTVGILLNRVNNSTLAGNSILSGEIGIRFMDSWNNTVADNTISNNFYGVLLISSENNTVAGNAIIRNTYGISLSLSGGNTFSGNNVSNNIDGIHLSVYSDKNTLINNTISDNYYGIELVNSLNNLILARARCFRHAETFLRGQSDDKKAFFCGYVHVQLML